MAREPEIEAVTQSLSITTFRFVPVGLDREAEGAEAYLNELNTQLLTRIQTGGEAFLSNAVVDDRFLLRACITNFRSTLDDVEALAEIVTRVGRDVDEALRPAALAR
jgi:glutamate/tyrosine decarboxylase-like PLP-dependent enzyme